MTRKKGKDKKRKWERTQKRVPIPLTSVRLGIDDCGHQVAEKKQWNLTKDNPHLEQAEAEDVGCSDTLYRILPKDAPKRSWKPRNGQWRSIQHWGQRKLLLSELEFLTAYSEGKHRVLYAGSAPGTHIMELADMFPEQKFVLVDPNDFRCKESARIEIHQEFFTNEIAEKYKAEKVLFISDIRTGNPDVMGAQEVEQRVKADMDAQLTWHSILKPYRSMLKFRLPYFPGQTEYLDGFLWLPIWGRVQTTEARLVANAHTRLRMWDNFEYMNQLYYFNTETRVRAYEHGVQDCEGLDHCYDCAAEVDVLKEYLVKYIHLWLEQEVAEVRETMAAVAEEVRQLREADGLVVAAQESKQAEAAQRGEKTSCPHPPNVSSRVSLSPAQMQVQSEDQAVVREIIQGVLPHAHTAKFTTPHRRAQLRVGLEDGESARTRSSLSAELRSGSDRALPITAARSRARGRAESRASAV